MNTLKKWLPTILPLLTLLATAVSPAVQDFVKSEFLTHPALATGVMTVYSVITHLLPQPQKSGN